MTTPSGKVIAYSFNSQGQIAGIALDGNPLLSSATYYPFGGIQQFSFANGQLYKREYDLDGRIKNLTLGPDIDLIPDPNLSVGYDNLDRLISATNPAKPALGYTYDGVGNRLTQTTGTSTTTYTYPGTSHKLSALTGAQSKSFGYDAAGNMITVGSLAFTYDGRGRAKQSGTASNLINGLGQRVAKTVSGNPTYFAYDEQGKLIGEYDASGALIQETGWLNDQPVVTVKPKLGGGYDVFQVWADNLNTPRAISRPVDNQLVWRWENVEPFGNSAANENPNGLGAFAYNLRFPGQYFDQETGTNYNYFRDYDPSTGRYIESDPIGLDGGLSTFAYVRGRPVNLVDPLGLVAYDDPGGDGGITYRNGFPDPEPPPKTCRGTWFIYATKPALGIRGFKGSCRCYWMCEAGCPGSGYMWSGILSDLPSTPGTPWVNYSTSIDAGDGGRARASTGEAPRVISPGFGSKGFGQSVPKKSGKAGSMGSGNACICDKPGPEVS